MKDYKKYREIRIKLHRMLLGNRHLNCVEIYGNLVYLTECELRALQLLVKQTFEENEAKGKELQDNILVYSGGTKRKSKSSFRIGRDGYFEGYLEQGFYNTAHELAMRLL